GEQPAQVHEVDPRGGAHHVDHQALLVHCAQPRLRLLGDAHRLEVAGAGASGAGVGPRALSEAVATPDPYYMVSGVAMPSSESPERNVNRTASVSASRAARIASFPSTSTRLSRSWLPSVYQRLKAAATSSTWRERMDGSFCSSASSMAEGKRASTRASACSSGSDSCAASYAPSSARRDTSNVTPARRRMLQARAWAYWR